MWAVCSTCADSSSTASSTPADSPHLLPLDLGRGLSFVETSSTLNPYCKRIYLKTKQSKTNRSSFFLLEVKSACPTDSLPVPVRKAVAAPGERLGEQPQTTASSPPASPQTLAVFTARSQGQNSSGRNSGGNSLLYQHVSAEIPLYQWAARRGTGGRRQQGRAELGPLLPHLMGRRCSCPVAHHPHGCNPKHTYCLQAELWPALLPPSLCPWMLSQLRLFISCGLFFLPGPRFPA